MTNQNSLYFRLFACCIPVKGALRSTICDLQRKEVKLIPNSLYTILTEYQDHTYQEICEIYDYDETLEEYYNFLVDNELGFWIDTPALFPALDLTWDTPSLISQAIIDVNEQSNHNFKNIFSQLEELGCSYVQIRYYTNASKQTLIQNLESIKKSRLRSIELVVKYDESLTMQEITDLFTIYGRIHRLILHAAPQTRTQEIHKTDSDDIIGQLICITNEITSADHCGVIDPYYFTINTKTFTEAQHFNTCLNGKIGIDVKGEIKNCPSLDKSFGNIREVSLHQALLKKDFKALWEINKDQVETCKDCEFRYICTDCRAFIQNPEDIYSKPSKCSYNPYTATWEDTPSLG